MEVFLMNSKNYINLMNKMTLSDSEKDNLTERLCTIKNQQESDKNIILSKSNSKANHSSYKFLKVVSFQTFHTLGFALITCCIIALVIAPIIKVKLESNKNDITTAFPTTVTTDNGTETDVTTNPTETTTEPVTNSDSIQSISLNLAENLEIKDADYYYSSDGMILYEKDNLIGFMDDNGKSVISNIYKFHNAYGRFSDGYSVVEKQDGLLAILDKTGNEIVLDSAYKFDGFCYEFHNNRLLQYNTVDKEIHVFDSAGQDLFTIPSELTILDGKYSCDKLIGLDVGNNNNLIIIDLNGNINRTSFDLTDSLLVHQSYIFNDNLFSFSNSEGKFGVIDVDGNVVIDFKYEALREASEGYIPFLSDGKWGYLDYKGTIVIPAQFENAFPFSNGLAAVLLDGKIGYINYKGDFEIQPFYNNQVDEYEFYPSFYESGIAVYADLIIDKHGNVISNNSVIYNGGNYMVDTQNNVYKLTTN